MKIKKLKKITIILTLHLLMLTQSYQWVGVEHAAQIHLLNSSPMTGSAKKNKMIVVMAMMI